MTTVLKVFANCSFCAIKRASAQTPKPTIEVLDAITPTRDSVFPPAENSSKAIVEGNKNSPAETTKAIEVIDTASGWAPKTAKDDRVLGLSESKKRLADTSLERHDHKRTKQTPDPSNNGNSPAEMEKRTGI